MIAVVLAVVLVVSPGQWLEAVVEHEDLTPKILAHWHHLRTTEGHEPTPEPTATASRTTPAPSAAPPAQNPRPPVVNDPPPAPADPVERWRPLVAEHFEPEHVDTMMCIMGHESQGVATAKNPRSSARGLFQILASLWAPHFGVTYQDLYDPETNVRLARAIFDQQGYGAWAPYGRGLCRGM